VLIDVLSALATGRDFELFAADVAERQAEIARRLDRRRLLVVGGAGSIGAATIGALCAFRPAALHVVDHNENGLAELVRDLRSRPGGLSVPDFRTLPLDFGSPIMARFLREQDPYDYVLNFAAIKHVRSEKDTYSLLQMLDTNVLKPARLLRWLEEKGGAAAYFCVSTDKAANPVNLMGASKRLMEHVIFSGEAAPGFAARVTSARFANVAFSDGSLLQSFLRRLEKRQPLAVPLHTRRYFISLREAGQICLLASVCAPDRHLLVPRLDPAADLHDLETIARAVLRQHGFEPSVYDDEAQARDGVEADLARGCYPLLRTPLDTSGEKPYEEFVGPGEQAVEAGMVNLWGVPYGPAPAGAVARFLAEAEQLVGQSDRAVSKEQIVATISTVVPEFHHLERGKNLDARM